MTLPGLTPEFFEPFLGRIDRLTRLMEQAIPKTSEPRQREMLESLHSEILLQREKFVSVAIPEILETHREIGEKSRELQAVLAQGDEVRAKADELQRLIREKAREMAMKASNPPEPPAPPPPAEVQEIPLLHGDKLRDLLMAVRKPPKPPALHGALRTTGNIWENWEPGRRDP